MKKPHKLFYIIFSGLIAITLAFFWMFRSKSSKNFLFNRLPTFEEEGFMVKPDEKQTLYFLDNQ